MTEEIRGNVVGIFRYPVSSLAGERLDAAWLGHAGVEGDRRHGLFDRETGLHIYPARDSRWNAAPLLHARLNGERLEISDDGASWAAADDDGMLARFAEVLGRPVDLRAYDEDTKPRYKVAPLHLLSLQSMEALRAHLPASLLDERRFRPSILLDLPGIAGEVPEYALLGQEFSLGGLRLKGTTPCGRCGFTTLQIGELPSDPSVLRTLLRRFERNFGIYCEVVEPGPLDVGATLLAKMPAAAIDPVVIVGAGQAGAMTARALRRLGYTGEIRLHGNERHAPYERPPLSKRIAAEQQVAPQPVLCPRQAEELGVALRLNMAVTAIDPARRRIETEDGSESGFGTLVLATGGIARRLPEIDRGFGRIHVLRTIEDAERLAGIATPGSRIAILGGGWIGMEIASAARRAGAEVTLFARAPRLAPRLLPEIVSARLEALHRDAGVRLCLGTEPRLRESAEGVLCSFGAETFAAEHLLLAVGMVANDGLARRAGLDCADGIVVDESCATAVPGVYAVGDVARPPPGRVESWQNANQQAERAARRILGLEATPQEPPYFWSDQYGHRLQIAGMPRPDATLVAEDDGRFWDFGDFAIGLDAPEAIHRFSRRLAGLPRGRSAPAVEAPPPERRREYALCDSAEVPEGALIRHRHPVGGALAVTRQGGRVYVADDGCPHAVASLAEGFVEEGRIICPLHFAEFDLEDGTPHNAPEGCGRLAVHPASERQGRIYVALPEAEGENASA